jgi:CheY-like chemotaxis protein
VETMHILLAEDQLIIQRVTSAQLKKAGYRVDTADNGAEAISSCKKAKYDLILMDLMMPEVDGFRATQSIRKIKRYQKTPIIAFTALNDRQTIERCLQIGINEVVNKWVKKDELFSIIDHWAEQVALNGTGEHE